MDEDISTGDVVFTWSFEEGRYIPAPILCNVYVFEKEKEAYVMQLLLIGL